MIRLPAMLDIRAPRALALRYGENPHQSAALYSLPAAAESPAPSSLQGKELSYNNLVDLDAAWQLIRRIRRARVGDHQAHQSVRLRGSSRRWPKAIGGRSRPIRSRRTAACWHSIATVDRETAAEIAKTFIEAIAAPGYSEDARRILAAKKNLRLLARDSRAGRAGGEIDQRRVSGADRRTRTGWTRGRCQVKTKRAPTEEEWTALEFAWKVAKHVKSNAIVYARAGQTISVGAGQMSRVDSVKVGAMKAVLPLAGTVLASDAFFPFPMASKKPPSTASPR